MVKGFFRHIYQALPFKKVLFTLLRSVYIPPRSIYEHLYFTGKFRSKIDGKSFFMVNLDSALETSVFWTGSWEAVSQNLWVSLCKESRTIFDIGANTGLYALIAQTINPLAKVICFEPIPRIFHRLVENCALNGYLIDSREDAISNVDGESIIYDLPLEHHRQASLSKEWLQHLKTNLVEVKVSTKRLDTFIEAEKIENVDLVKIDVESFEPEVIEGMSKYLPVMRPDMIVEIMDNKLGARIEEVVEGLDYLFYDIDEAQGQKRVNKIASSSARNVLICKRESAIMLDLL